MSYKNKTKTLQLESIGAGEFISESAEESTANKIENALVGAISMHSGGHGVFKVGDFATAGDSGGFTINLSSIGATPAAQGFIKFAHFRVISTIQWVIAGDGTHQLYISKVEDGVSSTLEHGDVTVGSTTDPSIPDDSLLIATAVVAGNTITLDSSPSSRLDIDSISTHIAQDTNPHTSHLVQTNMFISGLTSNTIDSQTFIVYNEFHNSGTSTFSGRATFDQDVHITQNMLVSGLGLYVNNESTFSGTGYIQEMFVGNLVVHSGLEVLSTSIFRNDITLNSGVTVDGRDLSRDGTVLDDHIFGISSNNNPHGVTAAQVSGIPHSGSSNGGPSLEGNLDVLSGVTIDGVDVSELAQLLNGGNADHLHTHATSGLQVKTMTYSPEYDGSVFSGNGIVNLFTGYNDAFDENLYSMVSLAAGQHCYTVVKRTGVPADFSSWTNSGLTITHGVSTGASDPLTKINVTFRDTDGTDIAVPTGLTLQKNPIEETSIDLTPLNSGVFELGKAFSTFIQICTNDATASQGFLGDLVYEYNTVF